MELKELVEKTFEIFDINSVEELSTALFDACLNNQTRTMSAFADVVDDLSVDWLQKIFQYYEADRKGKKQDYTSKSLAEFVGRLAGDADTIIDMCAGSGALTIQKWNSNHNLKFQLYEIDEKAISYLLFNLSLRNIEAVVYHADILQGEVFHTYRIRKGEKYGIVQEDANG